MGPERTRAAAELTCGVALVRGLRLTYGCRLERLDPLLRRSFVQLAADADTRAWIDDCFARPHGPLAFAARALARKVLSDYDANALVGIHDMRVLGTAQWRRLLGMARVGGRLLDVGAGDGHVTATLAPLFDEVVATELSGPMARRLRRRGWSCHEVDVATEDLPGAPFDAVAALNVLDRTARPITLVERLRTLVVPGGVVLLAVPFPLRPHVHVGPATVDPEELLPVAEGWEAQANALVGDVFEPCGLRLRALARAPYLCRGGAARPVTFLDDAVFALEVAAGP